MHHLNLIILKILSKEEKSGYDLMREIKVLTGWKPSSGSIYPMLNTLLKKKLICVRKKDRKKLYWLSEKGKSCLKGFDKGKNKIISEMQENIKIMESICDIPGTNYLVDMLERYKRDEMPFGDLTHEMVELRNISFMVFSSPNFNKNKEKIKKIMGKAIAELKQLK